MLAALKGFWAAGIHDSSPHVALAPDSRRAHAWIGTYRDLRGRVDRRRGVSGLLAALPHAQRMDSMAQRKPYETSHASLRPPAKAASQRTISGCNHWRGRHREYWTGMDCPEQCDPGRFCCCSALAESLFSRSVALHRDDIGLELPDV